MTWVVTRGEFTVTCDTLEELQGAVAALSAILRDEEWATRVEAPPVPFGPVKVDTREAPAELQTAAKLPLGFPAKLVASMPLVDIGSSHPVGEHLTDDQYRILGIPNLITSEPPR